MKSEKKRANHENAQPLKYYPTTTLRLLLSAAQSEIMRTRQKACWHPTAAARHRITPQNLRVCALYTTREYGIPSADLFRRLQLHSCSFLTRQLLNETDRLFCDEAVPLESQRPKIERLQPPPRVAIENWMLQILPPGPEFSNFAIGVLRGFSGIGPYKMF